MKQLTIAIIFLLCGCGEDMSISPKDGIGSDAIHSDEGIAHTNTMPVQSSAVISDFLQASDIGGYWDSQTHARDYSYNTVSTGDTVHQILESSDIPTITSDLFSGRALTPTSNFKYTPDGYLAADLGQSFGTYFPATNSSDGFLFVVAFRYTGLPTIESVDLIWLVDHSYPGVWFGGQGANSHGLLFRPAPGVTYSYDGQINDGEIHTAGMNYDGAGNVDFIIDGVIVGSISDVYPPDWSYPSTTAGDRYGVEHDTTRLFLRNRVSNSGEIASLHGMMVQGL